MVHAWNAYLYILSPWEGFRWRVGGGVEPHEAKEAEAESGAMGRSRGLELIASSLIGPDRRHTRLGGTCRGCRASELLRVAERAAGSALRLEKLLGQES